MDDGYSVSWDKPTGLIFRDPQGRVVPTHVENYVPVLGTANAAFAIPNMDQCVTAEMERVAQAVSDSATEMLPVLEQVAEEAASPINEIVDEGVRVINATAANVTSEVSSTIAADVDVKEYTEKWRPKLLEEEIDDLDMDS